jgi:hypothetical protein
MSDDNEVYLPCAFICKAFYGSGEDRAADCKHAQRHFAAIRRCRLFKSAPSLCGNAE